MGAELRRAVGPTGVAVLSALVLAACGSGSSKTAVSATTGGSGSATSAASSTSETTTAPAPPDSGSAAAHTPESSIMKGQDTVYPNAPASQATSPRISPASGSATTNFTLSVVVRTPLGAHGKFQHYYRVNLVGVRPACGRFTDLVTGTVGKRSDIAVSPPSELGWCPGTYHGQVLLQTSPNCVPTTPAKPCHLFAPRYALTGRFTYTVH